MFPPPKKNLNCLTFCDQGRSSLLMLTEYLRKRAITPDTKVRTLTEFCWFVCFESFFKWKCAISKLLHLSVTFWNVFFLLHSRGNHIKHHAFAGFSPSQQITSPNTTTPLQPLHAGVNQKRSFSEHPGFFFSFFAFWIAFFIQYSSCRQHFSTTDFPMYVWISETLNNIRNPYYATSLYLIFSFTHSHIFSLSSHFMFLLTFPSLVWSQSPAAAFHSPVKVVGCHLKASVRMAFILCGCVLYICPWVCNISPCDQTPWKRIKKCTKVSRSVQHTKPCRLSVGLLFIHIEREWNRGDREKEGTQEAAWCLIWCARMSVFVCDKQWFDT